MISVIIPLYNKGEKILRTINSVINQNFADMEIIVVDDGSTDDGAKYVQSINSPLIRYYFKPNGGVSSARNYGIEKSKGQWLYFLDADDELMPGAFILFEKMMLENKDCLYYVGNMIWNSNGNSQTDEIKTTTNPYFSLWLMKLYPCPRNMMVHRSLIEKYGAFDERMSFFEDWDFSLRMAKCGKIVYTNHIVAKYNQESDGLSGKIHPLQKEMAYYIPEMHTNNVWYRSLLYENIEFMIYYCASELGHVSHYISLRNKQFSIIYKFLHLFRQRFIVN